MSKQLIAVALVAVVVIAAAAVIVISGHDDGEKEPLTTIDAAGNDISGDFDDSRIMTIGVGTLRWVSYFGLEDNVVCIDAGDANASSWNGKGYRSLFDFDANALIAHMKGSQAEPVESHVKDYGMAVHDHNGFSTANLESLAGWNEKPTLTIVSKSVYDGFTAEFKEGLSKLTKVVVIYEVDEFVDESMELSGDFKSNTAIMGTVLGKQDRAKQFEDGINALFKDISGLVDGKDPVYGSAYIGSASLSGSKDLTSTVGSYLPFQLAGIMNSYKGAGTTAVDIGSEGISSCNPDVIFMDLSGTTKFMSDASKPIRVYAQQNGLSVYTLLPYFWFGYNFDNAIADAYFLIYACYDGILTYEKCIEKMADVYELFLPGAADLEKDGVHGGEVVIDNMNDNFYSVKGSKLLFDGSKLVCDESYAFVKA